MKTCKHLSLRLIRGKGSVRAQDLVTEFDYSPATARSYLVYLTRQDLLHRTSAGHALTARGQDRLHFFEVVGCGNPDCPCCEKKTGHYTCPTCAYELPRAQAALKPVWDTPFFTRAAGVYCPFCHGQIFSEAQASFLCLAKE